METAITTAQPRSSSWFWAGWGLSFVGFPLGGLAATALVGGVDTTLEGLIGGAATGTVVGLAEWLVLSRRLPVSPWWIAATSAGMALGLALGTQFFGTDTTGSAFILRAIITGAGIGLAQTAILRRSVDNAPVWGLVVTLGWLCGWITTRAAGIALAAHWSVFGSTGAWVFQLLTGLTLAWLLRQRKHAA